MNAFLISISTLFPAWLLLLVVALGVVVGDYFAKLWSIEHKNIYVIALLLCYSISALLFLPVLLKEKLAVATVVWSMFMFVGSLLVAVIIFKEELSLKQIVGIVFAVCSIFLVSS